MIEQLIAAGAARGLGAALVTAGGQQSYANLLANIDRVAITLSMRGVGAGQVAIVHTNDASEYWTIFFALERCGAISCALPAAVVLTGALRAQLRGDWVVSASASPPAEDATWIAIDALLSNQPHPEAEVPEPVREPGDPICIVLSSGTTGEPKQVLLSRTILDLRTDHAIESGFTLPQTRMACFMPFHSIGGILAALQAWRAQGTFISPLGSPLIEALSDDACDSIVVAPVHCQQFLDHLPKGFERQTPLTIFCGGGTLHASLRDSIARRLNGSVIEGYGTTETGIVTKLTVEEDCEHLNSAGKVLPWFDVTICDEAGNALPHGQIGQVRIRADEIVTGYHGEGSEESPYFVNGWYLPGDLGSLDSENFLTIAGRSDDMMNFGGRKAMPGPIEDMLRGLDGMADVAVFSAPDPEGTTDRMWVASVWDGEHDLEAIDRSLAIFPSLSVVNLDAIPRNAMGKIMREDLRRRVLAGDFADAHKRLR